MAERFVVSDCTFFIVAAGHDLTGVHTSSSAADINTADMILGTIILILARNFFVTSIIRIQWVTCVAIQANTSTVMVISDTTRVGATLDIAASINTSVRSLHMLTNLIVSTIQIIFTGDRLASVSPAGHEHRAWWLPTEHRALAPQGLLAQGSVHLLLMQAWFSLQVAEERQPSLHVTP